jgi:hypothetical protein
MKFAWCTEQIQGQAISVWTESWSGRFRGCIKRGHLACNHVHSTSFVIPAIYFIGHLRKPARRRELKSQVELGPERDADGWSYGSDFSRVTYPFARDGGQAGLTDFVRVRRWVRVRYIQTQLMKTWSLDGDNRAFQELPILAPGSALQLPLDACDPGLLRVELAMRPMAAEAEEGGVSRLGATQWEWSVGAASNKGATDDDQLHLVPSELQSGTLLMRCARGFGERACHLMAAVTGEQLRIPAGFNAKAAKDAKDWTVCLQAPLCVQNATPHAARYIIFEQRRGETRRHELQTGRVEPFGDVHVYAADMTAPLLMVFEPDDGWSHAEPVTIYAPSEKRSILSEAAESGKEMIRSRSMRLLVAHVLPLSHRTYGRVQLRLEYNSDALNAAHHVRVQVPMWLHNLSPFTLSYVLKPVKGGAPSTTDGGRKAPREERRHTEQGSFKVYQTAAAAGNRDAAAAAAAHVVSGRQRVMLDAEFGEAALSVAVGASCHSELIPLDQVRRRTK